MTGLNASYQREANSIGASSAVELRITREQQKPESEY
jgi:hypothetical protein